MMGPLAEMDREGIAHRRVERGDRADRPPVKEADMEVLELMEGVAQL